MKNSKLHSASKLVISLFLILGLKGMLIAQNITITGPLVVGPSQTAAYDANFTYTVNPSSVITWSCTGGVILTQQVNPNLPINCTVKWGSATGLGTLCIYETPPIGPTQSACITVKIVCGEADGGPDVTLCFGGCSIIGVPAQPNCTYSWTPTTGLSNPNIAQPTACPLTTTTYTVVMQQLNGCPVTQTSLTVTVNQRVSFSGNITYGCPQIIQQIIPNSTNYFCSFWECGGSTTLQSDYPTGNEWYVNGVHIIPPGGEIIGVGSAWILQNSKTLTHQPTQASGSLTEFTFQLKNSVWGCEELSPPTTVVYGFTFHPVINWMGFYKPNYTLNVSTPWNYTYGPGTIYSWNIPNTIVTQPSPAAPQASVFFPANVPLSGVTGTVTISNSPYCNGTYPINFEYNSQLRSIGEPEEKKSIVAYPNPATAQTTIKSNEAITEIEILDINNVISYLKKKAGGNNTVTLDISGLKPGIYLCKVITKTKTEFLKMQIAR